MRRGDPDCSTPEPCANGVQRRVFAPVRRFVLAVRCYGLGRQG